jgi:hypothetical protein
VGQIASLMAALRIMSVDVSGADCKLDGSIKDYECGCKWGIIYIIRQGTNSP